jgi:hypothetical protein
LGFLSRYRFELDLYDFEALIKTYIKAAIAEQLFSMDLKVKILASTDPVIGEVLKQVKAAELSLKR